MHRFHKTDHLREILAGFDAVWLGLVVREARLGTMAANLETA
jgi:hypothetical protein